MFVFLFCYVLLLFCMFYVFALFLPMYIVVYFLFVYSFIDHCHWVETQLQLINIITSYYNFQTTVSHLTCSQFVSLMYIMYNTSDCYGSYEREHKRM